MNNSGKPHILVIDDNEDILTMLQAMLQHAFYQVSVFDDPHQLLQNAKNLKPDLILMDKLLSGADGCEFCKQLKADATLAQIPVVMISAHPQARQQCLAAGANFFVEKPFEMQHLLQTISTALK